MTQRWYYDNDGKLLGSYDGPDEHRPEFFDGATVGPEPEDARQVLDLATGVLSAVPVNFKPIPKAPFWLAALELLTPPLTKTVVLSSITDPIQQEAARINIEDRSQYLRDDPLINQLAGLQNITAGQMDDLWLYVQEHYV